MFVPTFVRKWRLRAQEHAVTAYRSRIEEALISKDEAKTVAIFEERDFEQRFYTDQLSAMETGQLLHRAKRELLEIPPDSDDNSWQRGVYTQKNSVFLKATQKDAVKEE